MALLPAPTKPDIQVWHVWRRPKRGGAWECVAGVKGTKVDAIEAVETLEGQASYEDYEYAVGDERPPVNFRMRRRFD